MSLLLTQAEDLVFSRTKNLDARSMADLSKKNNVDDIVSDPARTKPDDSTAATNKAVAMGRVKVHQEQLIKEANGFNKKAFINKPEQDSFVHFMALSELRDPITGQALFDDMIMLELASSTMDFVGLRNMMSERIVSSGLTQNEEYLKNVKSWVNKVDKVNPDSTEVLMWRTLTSRLQPQV